MQRAGRYRRCIYRPAEGGTEICYRDLGLHRVSGCSSLLPLQADIYVRSHIIIMAIVAAFTVYFFYANRKQSKGKKVIEETVSRIGESRLGLERHLIVFTGWLPLYVLILYGILVRSQ